jgi:hypothetical protein
MRSCGYLKSCDYGETWCKSDSGLGHHSLHGLAIDSQDLDTMIVSAASGLYEAHYCEDAESSLYRRNERAEPWSSEVRGFPHAAGTLISILASNPSTGGEFFAANNRGVFMSVDSGAAWEKLEIDWSNSYLKQHAWSVCVVPLK